MPQSDEYVAILRCQTWNVWPAFTGAEYQTFKIEYGASTVMPARLIIISYDQRTSPENYINEETQYGPLLWDGKTKGLYRVRDEVLAAPDDRFMVEFQHRHAQRGEVDICINFKFDGELPPPLVEALRATVYAALSLLNLHFKDYLTPQLPFQLRKVLSEDSGSFESAITVAIRTRYVLSKEELEPSLSSIAQLLSHSPYGEKLRVALELYAAHFNEQQIRVRFLLLVIAIESLAKPTAKHQVAITLLTRWAKELETEKGKYDSSSEEYRSLDALSRELNFREDDSIRSQLRKLFLNLPGFTPNETEDLQRRALRVYDKRSALVHDGYLPIQELAELEVEARSLIEKIFVVAIEQSKTLLSSKPPIS
ncbi:MAG: HEPN domain-containing protein [Caldilineaceae bacterium]